MEKCKMAKSKQKSSKSQQFAAGGSKGMFGKQSAVKQKPGMTSHAGPAKKWPGKLGGSGKMFGKSGAKPAKVQ
jgi:hypothetical protein